MIPRIRDAGIKCPMCGNNLKTDAIFYWCENADCDFTKLYGELEQEVKKAEEPKRVRRKKS